MATSNGLEQAAEIVERAKEETFSKQSRFANFDRGQFMRSVIRWVGDANLQEPPYDANSSKRDTWLLEFVKREPHIIGALSSVISVDKNRAWTLTGGRNQVNRYTAVLHDFDGGMGWREGLGRASNAFWGTDMGSPTELGRIGTIGPVGALYNMDPTLCQLQTNIDYPLRYNDPVKGWQDWPTADFFRVTSMPSVQDKYKGLGFCAVSRALELCKTMVAIYQHDQESLLARAPRGIMTLQGISDEQWRDAVSSREAELDGLEHRYFNQVLVLASMGVEQIDAKLIALSQLPAGFDIKVTTDLLMMGIALCFGYDVREFWAVSSGALGTATETEAMHRKAGSKGGLDFVHGFQERLQEELPDALQFEFEERDADGDLRDAEVALAQIKEVVAMYEAGLKEGRPLVSWEEGRILLAEKGRIPAEWTEAEEASIATDTEEARVRRLREKVLSNEVMRRAIELEPDEPVIRYKWDGSRKGRTIVLWDSGASALHRRAFPVAKVEQRRERVRFLVEGA